ncbi:MAG TPA: hypothetical protein VM536_11475 [Chloroflexia bacterium]|nr:hypothetical protein [Chloroflexia bacterium]
MPSSPRRIVGLCLAAWLLLAPAGAATFLLNLAHLQVRGWDPRTGPHPVTTAATIPDCQSSVFPPDAACRRIRALVALAAAAPAGPAEARRILATPPARDALDAYWLGVAAERAGDHRAALVSWAGAHAGDALLARGTGLLQARAFAAAEAEFGTMITAVPAEPLGYLGRGRARAGQGQWPAALADFRQALALGGGPVAETEYGAALWYANHDLAGAKAALEAAWTSYPTAWGARIRAQCLLDAGQAGAALQAADAGLQRFPGDADLVAVRAHAARGTP